MQRRKIHEQSTMNIWSAAGEAITICPTQLAEEERANMEASREIVAKPTQIPVKSALAACLSSLDTQFIQAMEHVYYAEPGKGPRFIATKGVFTCISLFACAPGTGRALAAHIAIPQLHYACRHPMARKAGELLAELTWALKQTFKQEPDRKAVKVHLVGGQAMQDIDRGLAASFPHDERKHSFAWHVIGCVQRAGLAVDEESQRLLNVFPGIPFRADFEQVMSARWLPVLLAILMARVVQVQRRQGHSFSLVALDRQTGAVVTHTLFEQEGCYRMACLGERDWIEEQHYRASMQGEHARHGRRSLRAPAWQLD
jgi:hypothetical protein